tara:strand:- start:2809 stop:3081 length:273 start_codon:yes stop_codon:yes gene_type:complete
MWISLSEAWADFSFTLAGLVALAYFTLDILYGYYTICITKRKAWQAATAASGMYLLIALGVTSVVSNYLYGIPLLIGAWIGTYLVVKLHT